MGALHIKSGDTFRDKTILLGSSIEQQLEALNKMYEGKVEFCIDEHEPVICIIRSSKDTHGLDLPECDYLSYEKIFNYYYMGGLSLIRLPKCMKHIDMRFIDCQISYLNTLIIPEETEIVNLDILRDKPGRLVIEGQKGNRVITYGACSDRRYRNAYL